jgi:hypothetical protein
MSSRFAPNAYCYSDENVDEGSGSDRIGGTDTKFVKEG